MVAGLSFLLKWVINYCYIVLTTLHTEYFEGLILMPPLAPPKGTSTTAHLKVIRVAKACTSSISTSSLYLIPLKYKLIH